MLSALCPERFHLDERGPFSVSTGTGVTGCVSDALVLEGLIGVVVWEMLDFMGWSLVRRIGVCVCKVERGESPCK